MQIQLLWVDDQIAGLGTFVEKLKSHGFAVSTASSTSEAMASVKKQHFDLALVDIRMPAPDGIECLRQLHQANPGIILASLSSFHYLDRYKQQLRALEFRVQPLDKDFPDPLSPDFETGFVAALRELAANGVTTTLKDQEQQFQHANTTCNPFDISLSEFNKLPLIAKDQLRLAARKMAHPLIERTFAQGNLWVMFCGSKDFIRAQASSIDQVYDEDKLIEIAKEAQRPVYYFWNDVSSDDQWSSCGQKGFGPTYYPTVTLQFETSQIRVHFDTGSPFTFFSYEELLALEAIPPTMNFGPGRRNGFATNYWAAPLHIKAQLRCQRSDQTIDITITGQAIRDWEASPFARKCSANCPIPEGLGQAEAYCPDRKALVGRNLLIENALVLVLNGKEQRTCIHIEDL